MRKKILITLGVLIVITSGLLISVLNMRGQMISYAMQEEENLTGIAMYVHDGSKYNKSTSVPIKTHVLNRSKTKCEGGGSVVSYNRSTGVLEYRLPTADMCYVYFDKDTTPPTVSSLSLNNGATYSNSRSVTAVMTFPIPEDDWTHYCLTLDSDGSDCTSGNKWQTFNSTSTSMSVTYTFSEDGKEVAVYAFIKDIADNISSPANDAITVDTQAPTNFEYYKVYQILEMRDYSTSNYSAVGGKGGTWTVGGNGDAMIHFRDVSDIKGIMGGYVRLAEALSYSLPVQIFYADSGCGFNETNSIAISIPAGQIENFYLFKSSGNWTCFRFDIGNTVGQSFKLNQLGVFTTSSTESGAGYANWAGDPDDSTFTRFSAVDATSGVESFQYYGDGVPNWTSLNLERSNRLQVSGTTTTGQESWGLTNGRNQTYYFRACDKAKNCTSTSLQYNIKYDFSAPSVTSAARSGYNNVIFTTSDSYSGVKQYCINTSSNSVSGCAWKSTAAGTITTSDITHVGGTYYVHVRDKAGNIGHSNAFTMPYTLGGYVMDKKPSGFKSSVAAELYRFRGKYTDAINNHVCFGTSDKATCTGNTDVYMYRIIGLQEDYQVKLIKKEAMNNSSLWDGEPKSRTTVEQSWPFLELNGNSYLGNSTYVPPAWKVLMQVHNFYRGKNTASFNTNATTSEIHKYEIGTSTYPSVVGLMYGHDYFYAYAEDTACGEKDELDSTTGYVPCYSSWIHLPKNDSTLSTIKNEWTGSTAGSTWQLFQDYDYYFVLAIYETGALDRVRENLDYMYRPVIYLRAGTQFVSGSGTATDPFIIRTD